MHTCGYGHIHGSDPTLLDVDDRLHKMQDDGLPPFKKIYALNHFMLAISAENNDVYMWGQVSSNIPPTCKPRKLNFDGLPLDTLNLNIVTGWHTACIIATKKI